MLMPVAIQALAIPDVFFAGNPLKPLADKYNVTVGQILLSWAVARGISVIPKTEKEERLRANASVRDLLAALLASSQLSRSSSASTTRTQPSSTIGTSKRACTARSVHTTPWIRCQVCLDGRTSSLDGTGWKQAVSFPDKRI